MDHLSYQHFENVFFSKFDEDIYAFCKKIQDNIDSLKLERDFVFNKIDNTCKEVFSD
jgi:hypothetical protein